MEAAVRPERLLKDLRNLWVDLGKDEPAGVLRACAMTLIVVVEEERDAQEFGETARLTDARASESRDRPPCALLRGTVTVGSSVRAMLDALREPSTDLLRAG